VLFLGDSITEAMRGTQFGEHYEELRSRRRVFEETFPRGDALAFGIAGDRTQNLLYRVMQGELAFRHAPAVVVICIGTNNLGRDGDGAEETFLGITANAREVLKLLPETKVLLTGVLPRGPPLGAAEQMPPAPFETTSYFTEVPDSASGPRLLSGSREGTGAPSSIRPVKAAHGKYAQPGIHTAAIEAINTRLAAFASMSHGQVTYVDCAGCFLDERGDLVPEKMRDGLHPSSKGYSSWFARLLPEIRKLQQQPSLSRIMRPTVQFSSGSLSGLHANLQPLITKLAQWSPLALFVSMAEPDGLPGAVVYANANYLSLVGKSAEEVLGKACPLLTKDPALRPRVAELFQNKHEKKFEMSMDVVREADGTRLPSSFIAFPVRDSEAAVAFHVWIVNFAGSQEGGLQLLPRL
jgi:PAS domain S-box-containing protein